MGAGRLDPNQRVPVFGDPARRPLRCDPALGGSVEADAPGLTGRGTAPADGGVKPGARRAPSGRASRSPEASSAYDSGGRRTVRAALLTRMSNGSPSWRSSSHSPST
ncbi:hypothetical protein GCM10017779_56060 [Streptomyces capillispiralis]|nr:hypothetical protein GCM10017779_56060 [Streptomyces capillispiralis]